MHLRCIIFAETQTTKERITVAFYFSLFEVKAFGSSVLAKQGPLGRALASAGREGEWLSQDRRAPAPHSSGFLDAPPHWYWMLGTERGLVLFLLAKMGSKKKVHTFVRVKPTDDFAHEMIKYGNDSKVSVCFCPRPLWGLAVCPVSVLFNPVSEQPPVKDPGSVG